MSEPYRRTCQLHFRNEHLDLVMTGLKTCTLRVSKQALYIDQGTYLHLLFGRRDRPVLLESRAERVERFDLSAEVERWISPMADLEDIFSPPLSVTSSTATAEQLATATEEHDIPPALREALRDSGSNYDDLLAEMANRRKSTVTCVWWSPVA